MVEVGCRAADRGLIVASDGNLSARLGPRTLLITPTGASKSSLRPRDLLVVDLEGQVRAGRGRPSTELPMHLEVYRQAPGAAAVIHAHPPFATALTVAGLSFPTDVLPEIAATLGDVPTTDWAMPGTDEDAAAIRPLISRHKAILLRQHGTLTYGSTLEEAFHHLERLEHGARVFWLARSLGRVRRLPPELLAHLLALQAGSSQDVEG
jgi:L-fuculose-phosphate aldolase